MKMISWNVNGLRAVMGKGFMEAFAALDADIFCLQETKLQEGQIDLRLRAITSTGITRKRRAIPGRLSSAGRNRCPSGRGSAWRNLIMKAG